MDNKEVVWISVLEPEIALLIFYEIHDIKLFTMYKVTFHDFICGNDDDI